MPFSNYIYEYYDGISSGNITVGKWVRLLYEYIVKGLQEGLFTFNAKKANKAIRFIENFCHHCEGRTDLLKLELWQKAAVSVMFGIVEEDGTRVFREVFIVIGRKNGKTLFASAVIAYMAYLDGEYGAKGTLLALFSNDASRVAYPTAQCVSNSEYTNSNFSTSKGWYWWLRTPYSSYASYVRGVNSDGSLGSYSAYGGSNGVRPLCNLKSSILVSDSPNSDGNYTVIYNSAPSAPPSITAPAMCYSGQNINISCAAATDPDGDALTYCFERSYNSGAWTQVQASASRTFTEAVSTAWNTLKYRVRAKDSYGNYSAYTTSGDIAVIHNQPPVISGSNADLGTKRGDFTYQYSVTDPDGDTVNVVEKIDGKTIATKNAITLGATQTLSVSGNTFTALTNAQHTITITATDSAGNSAVRTLTFTKSIAGFVITLSTPLEANSQPTRANIKVTRDIPAGGTFKVEATNNPFDASPVWEDCTNAVVQGVAHVFTNKINTAAQYGMNIRVTVQRGDALTACWVSGIGGNFE